MTTTVDHTRDFELGRRLTEITMGIDAFERAESRGAGALDGEGLVPIFLGAGMVKATTYESWEAIFADIASFADDVAASEDGPRKTFLATMARSLRAAARFFSGAELTFREQLTDLVGVPAEPVSDETIATIHDTLDRLMTKLGYTTGPLAARVNAWQTGRYLDPADIPALFDELMTIAKERTDATVWPTGDYTMRLNAVRSVPYAGRCSFVDGNMDINLDVLVTRAGLKHLVCHEVFPGHSTQLLSTKSIAERGDGPLDALLCTANMVTGAMQEGIGDQGIELIDWVEDEHDAAQIEVRRLQTATGTNAAWHLHESCWTREESVAYLQDVGFGQLSWATVRTGMAQHPFRGAFLASYWFGNETVKQLREAHSSERRPALIQQLYRGVHSLDSLRAAL